MKIILAMLVLIPQLVVAASPSECKFQQVEIDPISKKPPYAATEKVRLTNWLKNLINREQHGHNSEFQATAVRERAQDFLELKVRLRRTSKRQPNDDDLRNALTIAKDAELLVLLADRTVIKLRAGETVTVTAGYEIEDGFYIIDTGTNIRYQLDASAVERLTQQDAVRMRFSAAGRLGFIGAGGKLDFEITEKARPRFRHVIGCLRELELEDLA